MSDVSENYFSNVDWIDSVSVERPDELEPKPVFKSEASENAAESAIVESVRLKVVTLEDFAAKEEDGAEPLMADAEGGAVIPEGSDVMIYGDGGAGKTTGANDLACHCAAGDDWLGFVIEHAVPVLVIENEGPRPLFRKKLARKLASWSGSPLEGRVRVLEEPWARFTFAEEIWRNALAAQIAEQEIDVLIVGPVTCAGMTEAGTLQDVRAFLELVADVRRKSGRRLTVILIHHENKGGQVSGAWEGAGDVLIHVQGQGHGRTRLYFQKARWASATHATALNLVWTEGEGFAVEDKPEFDDAAIAEAILVYVGGHAGTGWSKVEEATPGTSKKRRREIRDGLLTSGDLANVVKGVWLDHVEERKQCRLFLGADPAIQHLRPRSGADGAQMDLET